MTVFLDYHVPAPGLEITTIGTLQDTGEIKIYDETSLDECFNDLFSHDLIVTHERPYYHFRRRFPENEHLMEQYHFKERWYDLFSEIRKLTGGKQIALSKVAKGTLGDDIDAKIQKLAKSYGDPTYRPNLTGKMEDRLNALKEVFDYALKFGQVSYTQNQTTHWVEININESPPLEH